MPNMPFLAMYIQQLSFYVHISLIPLMCFQDKVIKPVDATMLQNTLCCKKHVVRGAAIPFLRFVVSFCYALFSFNPF